MLDDRLLSVSLTQAAREVLINSIFEKFADLKFKALHVIFK